MLSYSLPQRFSYSPSSHVQPLNSGNHQVVSNDDDYRSPSMLNDLQNPLQQFSSLANVDTETQASSALNAFYVVPDTNILVNFLDILSSFAEDVEKSDFRVVIVIPGAVVSELDWQKKDNWFSRKASIWIWEKIQEKKILKGQSRTENLKGEFPCNSNDDRIIECALYFSQIRPTVLCSADKNLCVKAASQGVESLAVMNPQDKKHSPWSSRVLGKFLFGPQSQDRFSDWKPVYTEDSLVIPDPIRRDDDMDIDAPGELEGQLYETDARDLLHRQVVEIFVGLLRVLVALDQQDRHTKIREGASASMHATSASSMHAQQLDLPATEMNIVQILDYVQIRCPSGPFTLPRDSPLLNSFLSKPYTANSGGRRGSDWSRQDWLISLRKLRRVAEKWGKRGEDIVNTLRYDLLSHLQRVFNDDDLVI
ncbi:hypothetical protein GYMLUDRAFT_256812 [Collybiopsis luxurians FD-317 M1]|nr:hypothetical protein GYMLUDRAFT_256812 [Collybiopsis luxurians FD-317 M1]